MRITLNADLVHFPHINKIAQGLAIFEMSGQQVYPEFLGHYGDLNNSSAARDSQLRKLHIALSKTDFELRTWQNCRGFNRTCNNFLIYVKHYMYDDYFQILDIVTPDAHKNIDKFIAVLVEKAEAFYQLNREQLDKLPFYSCKLKLLDEHLHLDKK